MRAKRQAALLALSLITASSIHALADGKTEKKPAAAGHATKVPFRLRFVNTDVSDVLQALSLRTHANIVFPAQLKKLVSINLTPTSVEEALRYITAAGGLAFRQVGPNYIVAPPAELRQALEPFGDSVSLPLAALDAEVAAKFLERALPYLTVHPAGGQLLLIGASEDIMQARTLLAEQDHPRPESVETRDVAVLQFVPATQAANVLKSMFPQLRAEAVGLADKPGGALGLSGPKSQVDGAREALRTLDVQAGPRPTDRIYRIYTIKYSSAGILKAFVEKAVPGVTALAGPEDYSPPAPSFHPLSGAAISSSGGGGTTGGAPSGGPGMTDTSGSVGSGPVSERTRTLVLNGTPADLDAAFKLFEQLDVPPQQVMVEVKVVDTSPEQAEQLGMTWNWTPFSFLENAAGTTVSTAQSVTKGAGIGQFSRVPWSFQSVLSAMVSHSEAKILANPRVQVINNDDANIFIGETIRTQLSQSSVSGTTLQVAEFPVGIILLVRPRINSDGKITMRVHPVVSTVDSVNADGLPQTSSREAETTVMVQDGETMVIGGLIQDQMSKVVTEVPFLSKLPLIGQLFRNRSTDHRHSDILVFITPHIVK